MPRRKQPDCLTKQAAFPDTGYLELYRADKINSYIVVIPRRFSNWKQGSPQTMQSPSSSLTADTASPLTSPEAGSHQPATSRKRKRKRTMAGYQVEQTTTGTGTFPPHQLQPESGAITAIKLRRVTDNSSSIACSSTSVPANPEPMETQPTEINSEVSISEFTVSQQNELRTHLNNQEIQQEIQTVLKNAGILLKTLNDRKIQLARDRGKPPANSLFSKLKNFSIVKDSQTFIGYFARANTFFLAVNTQQITNTSCLTSMLKSKTQIKKFAEESEENIQAVAANPCLKRISSMCNGRGIPTAKEVNDFVGLEFFKGEGRTLLPSISSMCHGRGIPTAREVNDFVGLEVFKGEGRTLLPSISSMCHGRGIPTAKEVNDFVGLEVFKGEGRTLLPSISSMCHGRGIPTAKKVNDFVGLEVFKGEGRTLLPSISSMCHGRGIPTAREVNDFVGLEVFKGEGRTLLPSISSMCHGRGIPTAKEVNDFVGLEVFKGEGRTLLPSISSMCNGRGIPTAKKVNDFVGLEVFKGEGRTLLPSISSMCHGRGMPTAREVNDFVGLEVFKGEGRTLLPSISSMCNGRGIPTAREVNDFVGLEVFKGEGRTLLPSISSMCNGRGIPTAREVNDFVRWLPSDEKKSLLKHSCRIFVGFGAPSVEKLTEDENKLRQCLKQQGYSTDIGGDRRDDEDELLESSQMKALVLFFSAPAKWNMTIAEFQQYLTAHKSPRNERVAVRAALKSLLPILAIHGGPGIRFWIEMHHKEPGCKESLTKALSIPAPLALTKFALTQLPEPGRQEYLELCKNLKPAPTQAQWNALKPLRQQLGQRFDFITLSTRTMLEILWPQSEDNRSKYADKMDELFKTVPTISQWHRLHRVLGPQKMQQFMDACLDYQAKPETAPDVTIQQRLLEGMLLTNHSLPEHIDIPDLCFSNRNRVSTDDKRGVIVEGDYVMSGQIRLWHFITAMLIELEQTEYQFKHQRLTVIPPDGAPVVLENPEFTLTDTGFVINNWTLEQLTAFFRATEFTEQWYEEPQDKRDLCAIRLEATLAQMKVRTKEPEKAEPKKIPHLVAPSLIIRLINCNRPLKPAVWSSLEHYASSGQLTTRLCKALNPVIQNDNDGVVPEHIKNAVAAKLVQIEATKTPVVTAAPQQRPLASTPTQGNQVSNRSIQGPLFTFDAAMEALDRFKVLGNAELELLEPHRSQMTYIELSTAISKMSYAVDSETRKEWNEASEKRIRDPLGLDEIVEWDFDSLATESELVNNQDWLEELLQ